MPAVAARISPVRDLLVTLIIFSSLPVILSRPYVGVLVWSWLGYMNPHRLTWGFAYNFPFSKVVAATLITALIFSPERKRIPITAITIPWLLFLGWICLTTANAMYPEAAQEMLSRILKIQLVVFITIMVMGTRERIEQLIWVIVFSLGFFGVKGGIYSIFKGGAVMIYGPGGFIEDNNAIAIALVMTLPLCQYLRQVTPSKLIRWGLLAAVVMICIAIVTTASRAAMLGGVAMAFMVWVKSRHRVATGLGGLLLLPFLFFWAPESWHERMATITEVQEETGERERSAQSRLDVWAMIINLAKDRPVLGAGLEPWHEETYDRYAEDPTKIRKAWSAHSIYFSVLAEHGFIGLGLFLSVMFFAFRGATGVTRACEGIEGAEWLADLMRMLQVSLVGYFVAGAFHQVPYFDLPWHLIGIVVIGQGMVRDMAERTAGSVSTPEQSAPVSSTPITAGQP